MRSSDIVSAAARGDSAALQALLTDVRRIAYRYCRARLGGLPAGIQAADDAAQEVCVAVLRSLPRYEDRGLPFEAFVYGIASNKVADAMRTTLRAPEPTPEVPDALDVDADPLAGVIRAERSSDTWALLDQLTPVQREIITLRVAVGMTADEVAASLGMTPGAVRVAQHRALGRLRSIVSEDQGDRWDQGDQGDQEGGDRDASSR
ncbi:RNA polymerase sigma factor ShbA [Arsenicicoccus sp. oral taxon 190]|uniref:RNA polymerase sigma factor ShbA n=1 Tax=Arsenicicoccus sp. oral taxon 190 TaxID=1658671 RepID=UPI00209D79AE|nr:RNA polymerase sigma factor ShbA [Arsenicicoccus sp. oral taxon 190]